MRPAFASALLALLVSLLAAEGADAATRPWKRIGKPSLSSVFTKWNNKSRRTSTLLGTNQTNSGKDAKDTPKSKRTLLRDTVLKGVSMGAGAGISTVVAKAILAGLIIAP